MVESIFDRFPVPPASQLLGWHVQAVDTAAGTIEIGFDVDDRFLNPGGNVHGGFIAAMLDDTCGPALFAMTDGTVYAPTINLAVTFINAALPGRFVGKGRVISVGRTIAYLEGELFDAAGVMIARAQISGRVMGGERATGFAR